MYKKISLISSSTEKSKKIHNLISKKIDIDHDVQDSDLIIFIGGDGELLKAMHKYMHLQIPFYPVNGGTVGFLTNDFSEDIVEQIESSIPSKIHPLSMHAENIEGETFDALSINESYIFIL